MSKVSANDDINIYTIENNWFKAEINTDDGSYIQQLFINKRPSFPSSQQKSIENPSFHLYTEHPFKTQEEMEMPALRRIRQLKDIDPNIPSVHWLGEATGQVSVNRIYAANATEAILHVTTTIENTGVKTLEFFPTESISLDISDDIGKATPDYYLYMPANAGGSVKQPSGEITEANGLVYLPDHNVFVSSYRQIPAHAAWRADRPWFALYNHQTRESLGFEVHVPSTSHLQPVDESLIFDSMLVKNPNDPNTESATLMMRHVIGKIILPPNESITYVVKFSVSNALTPIVSVQDGMSYSQRFMALAHPVGFYFAAAVGLPLTGKYGAVYYGENNQVIRRSHNLYGYNIDNQSRPQMLEAEFNIPTLLSTIDGGFGMTDENQSAVTSMHDKIRRIELVLLDPETLVPIKTIGEASAPWILYEQ